MRGDIDFATLAAELLLDSVSILPSWLPGGKFERREYVALNPKRADRSLGSFRINIDTGRWADFATGDTGGDLVALRAYLDGSTQVEAARKLAAGQARETPDPRGGPRPARPETRRSGQVIPAPEIDGVPDHPAHGRQPDGLWTYRTREGGLIGFVCRYNTPTEAKPNHKDFAPYLYFGEEGWRWRGFGDPRPLYGLETLEDGRPVIVVEGEKTAQAGRTLYPHHSVVTWPGGDGCAAKADWTPLHGRDVILWPDNDPPGLRAMGTIRALLEPHARSLRTVTPPDNCPPKWDLADARWSLEDAARFLTPPDDPAPEPEPPASEPPSDPGVDGFPFRFLGFDGDAFFYHSEGTQQIIELSATQHVKNHLLRLAPLHFWEMEYAGRGREKTSWDAAINEMFSRSHEVGIFDQSRVRGRGAWYERGKCVLNLGDRVICEGREYLPSRFESRYIYQAGIPIEAELSNPLPKKEANQLVALLKMMPWEQKRSANLLAGWAVCAHIGGALRWRPHVWIIGRAGSGKSTVYTDILGAIMGNNCLPVLPDTTEAGIRQTLGGDSIPVIFDEIENTDARASARIANILTLVRQSSSETRGSILKGSAGGKSVSYSIRSCFAFSSINASLMSDSDRSRVTVLELNRDFATHDYKADILPEIARLMTADYQRRFYARAIRMAPVIRDNAEVFRTVMAGVLGDQRAGDQMGTLLAGAYSLCRDRRATPEEAQAWIEREDFARERDEVKARSDEMALFSFVMNQRTECRISAGGPIEKPCIGELVDAAAGRNPDILPLTAQDTLKRIGMKVEAGKLFIANDSPHLAQTLRETAWSKNYHAVLRRLPGAESTNGIRFKHSQSSSRSVSIPLGNGEYG